MGHTIDVAGRDWEHTHCSGVGKPKIPFHSYMQRIGGRKKFKLVVLQTANSEEQAVKLENKLMNEYETWHEFGGQNFCRAMLKFEADEVHRGWCAAVGSSWTKKRRLETSLRMKANNPAKQTAVRKKLSAKIKKLWKDPEVRAKMLESNPRGLGTKRTKAQKKIISENTKAQWVKKKLAGFTLLGKRKPR